MPEFLPDLPDKNRLLVDWLSFTITDYSLEDIASLLGLSLSEFNPFRGRYGYKTRLSFGGINILIDGSPDQNGKSNICVEMSGQGCRDWETLGCPDYIRIFQMACNGELKLTRLDLAYDDFQGLLPFDTILEKSIDLKEVVTTWLSWEVTLSNKGKSISYGSRQSDCYARCYDKAAERGYCNGEHWIRFETVFKDEVALQVASLIIQSENFNDSMYFGILADKIRYVESSDDSNKSRWPTSEFWDNLTNNSNFVHLQTNLGDPYNLDKKSYHFFQQYRKQLITQFSVYGFDHFVNQLLSDEINLNSRYRSIIRQHGISDEIFSIAALYKLKSAIRNVQSDVSELYSSVKVGVSNESYD